MTPTTLTTEAISAVEAEEPPPPPLASVELPLQAHPGSPVSNSACDTLVHCTMVMSATTHEGSMAGSSRL
jgi:hypothetical protein